MGKMKTAETGPVGAARPKVPPRQLLYAAHPTAADVDQHGVQPLPVTLPVVDLARAMPYRSRRYSTVTADSLTTTQALQMARVVGSSFARREPQSRHLRAPKHPPAGLTETLHVDPFGIDAFGAWSTENIMYWFFRLFALTDPTSPRSDVRVNEEVLESSLAIVDGTGRVIGGAFNETMPPFEEMPEFREDDPFLAAALAFVEPVFEFLGAQDAEALTALSARYEAFAAAYAEGKVVHFAQVARSDDLPKADTFELVAASVEHSRALGYEYMVTEATNQWTSAAFEVLGGVRVHFAPFQAQRTVRKSPEPLEGVVTSPTGYVAGKDSGSMFLVIRL